MPTDISEKKLEEIIVEALAGLDGAPDLRAKPCWRRGARTDFDAGYALDIVQLAAFLEVTQPEVAAALDLNTDGPARTRALARIQGQITERGIVEVLRDGIEHGPHSITLFYGTPSPGNAASDELFKKNLFTVVRQLHFSTRDPLLSLDVVLFINGLPIITMELKNNLTKQSTKDAVHQYKKDRDPSELIFKLGRCMAHLAVDDREVEFCTELAGDASWFLPFNKGHSDGAGNPPNPNGLMTSYLWEEVLTPRSLTDIIENFAMLYTEEITNLQTGKKRKVRRQIFPRYHQLSVVRALLANVDEAGAGHRYLIEHSAGSGKSNSIAWLAHQLVRIEHPDDQGLLRPVFDSVVVVTDRRVLDRQISNTVKQFAQVRSIVGHADSSDDLRKMIEQGKKIIITTVQKFPHILDAIGDAHRASKFAIIIDEAHSSQSGRTATAMSRAITSRHEEPTPNGESRDEDRGDSSDADEIQDLINELMATRKLAANASYFAFTATPKNKTFEMFGVRHSDQGEITFRPFHTYSMKQAIDEGFILDVLKNYTPVNSYYRLIKTIDSDPEYDVKRAKKKLRRYVEGHEHAIEVKAEIMVDHFLEQIVARRLFGGESRAMVVTSSIHRAIQYYSAISAYLVSIQSPFRAIVAFSGEFDWGGTSVTEASMNEFPSAKIEEYICQDPYRFLVCAEKFQTGYDEPLLQVMYVDKILSGVRAVQTLSRLNRPARNKEAAFVLDFQNSIDDISDSFAPFYRTTVLAGETDANKLHNLVMKLDDADVYTSAQVDEFVGLFLMGSPRPELDAILDACVAVYEEILNEEEQVSFKSGTKTFVRTYDFLASILPYTRADWEKRSIFLSLLVSKLPTPVEEDLARGILDTIDMDSYRAEKMSTIRVQVPDAEGMLEPVPTSGEAHRSESKLDRLSNIIKDFNDIFGNIDWTDKDHIFRIVTEDIPAKVSADPAYQNAMRNSDRQNAVIEHDAALLRAIASLMNDDSELFRQFSDNPDFRRWLSSTIFDLTYERRAS
jgi:type I restriction enzyme R subunit